MAPLTIPKGRNQINNSLKIHSRWWRWPTPTIVYSNGYSYVCREWTRATFTYERTNVRANVWGSASGFLFRLQPKLSAAHWIALEVTVPESHLRQACKEEKSICYASRYSIIVSVSGRARVTWRIQDGRWRVHSSSIVQTKWRTHIRWGERDQTLKSSSHLYLFKIWKSIIVQTQDILHERFYPRLFVFVLVFFFTAPSGQWTKLSWHRRPMIVFMLRCVCFVLTSSFSPGGKQISSVPLDNSPGGWCK